MATSLDKLENKVQIHHRHVKRFHMVKRLRNSVQYVRRYSTKYAEPRRENNTILIRIFSSETTGPIFTKILQDVVALVVLFNLAHTQRYPIPFLNDRAISAGEGVGNFAPFLHKIGYHGNVPWGTEKKGSRSIIYTHKAFMRCKDYENRSSGSWDNLSPRNH